MTDNNITRNTNDENILKLHNMMRDWISNRILKVYLPKIITASVYSSNASTISQHNLIQTITDFIRGIDNELLVSNNESNNNTTSMLQQVSLVGLDTITTIRLCSLILVTTTTSDRIALLELLTICIKYVDDYHLIIASYMIRAISVQYLHDEYCQEIATQLQVALDERIRLSEENSHCSDDDGGGFDGGVIIPPPKIHNNSNNNNIRHTITTATISHNNHHHLIEMIEQQQQEMGVTESSLTKAVSNIPSFVQTHFSVIQQSGAMLYGICLLEDSNSTKLSKSSSSEEDIAYKFLHKLLERYPHLGISLLSVITVRINQASYDQNGTALIRDLEFICTSLVADSQSAQEVWNLVGIQWMNKQYSPVTVRVALIRLFPKLIEGNKRLYRRVIDCLTQCLIGNEIGIRLAAAATISELAQKDLIRDVTDVVTHIQGLLTTTEESSISLTPIHSLLVHYGLLSLHYLVRHDEMDFAVVMQVLKKKFCSVKDLKALLKLPLVVLESYVLLLGDGECGDIDDDDEKTNITSLPEQKIFSSHVKSAVQALIHIATFVGEDSENDKNNTSNVDMVYRVKMNALYSLSRYSLPALGINEDGINTTTAIAEDDEGNACTNESAERYMEIRDLLLDGMEHLPTDVDGAVSTDGLQLLCSNLAQFEEESLGFSLWQKRGPRSHTKDKNDKAVSKRRRGRGRLIHDSLSLLPSQSDVEAALDGRSPSVSTAIAKLFCCDGTKLDVLRDNADESIESIDPIMTAFAIHGFLHAASCFISSKSHSIKSVISEVMSWCEIQISADAMYLALCSLSVYIPHDVRDRENPTPFVVEICQRTMAAYRGHVFNKGNVSMLCFGLLGVSSLRYADVDQMNEIVDIIELSVKGYGGQHSFEAFYALAIISQAAQHFVQNRQCNIEAIHIKRLISRTVSFIVESLLDCFELPSNNVTHLLACLRSGAATTDLVDHISKLRSDSVPILVTKKVVARDLLISCAVCLPSLVVVSNELVRAVAYLLESLEWGSGKALALQPLLLAWEAFDSSSADELQGLHSGYVALLEGRTDTSEKDIDAHGLEEIFYVLNGTYWRPSPADIRNLIVGNRSLFDDEACKINFLASLNSIVSLFCLGATDIWALARLDSTVQVSEIKEIASIFLEMADTIEHEELSGLCLMITGILSSVKEIRLEKVDLETSNATDPSHNHQIVNEIASLDVDFAKLPRSMDGTLLGSTVDVIERLLNNKQDNNVNELKIARAILSLSGVSIPGAYAYSFLEPLMKGNVARQACITLLCSQVSGRRRSYVEGKSFLDLVTTICMETDGRLLRYGTGTAFEELVGSFHGIVPKIHFENLDQVLKNISDMCLASIESRNSLKMIHVFLSSMKQFLSNKTSSFKVLSTVRMFIVGEFLSSISGQLSIESLMSRTPDSSHSILHAFSLCLQEFPVAMLEEINFFKIYGLSEGCHAEIIRTFILLDLTRMDYFDTAKRVAQELSNVTAWLSKRLISSEEFDVYGYKRIACSYAAAISTEKNSASRREMLSSILDVLLLATETKRARLGLAWLSVVLAYWCDGNGSDSDLSLGYLCVIDKDTPQTLTNNALDELFTILLDDMSFHLVGVSRREKLSAIVSNYLHRLHDHWACLRFDNDVIECIRRIILLEQGNMGKEDGFVSLASSVLMQLTVKE